MSKRQDKQTMNNLSTLLFTICVAFYYEVHHWMFTLVRCKFPPWMMHGLDWRPRHLSSHLYKLFKLTKFPHLFGTMISIHKQKYMISIKCNLVQCWKLYMCQHISANSQPLNLSSIQLHVYYLKKYFTFYWLASLVSTMGCVDLCLEPQLLNPQPSVVTK